MKIYMTKSYTTFEVYGPLEINMEDYPQLAGKTNEEILEYFNSVIYDENIPGGSEDNLSDEFTFNTEMIKQKITGEEEAIIS